MTPAARFQAAIEILDRAASGQALEKVLTGWARRSRFAGSGDRAAIRDIVYDIQRNLRSCASYGGGSGGRALVLGHCRQSGLDPAAVFSGAQHAPHPLTPAEAEAGGAPRPGSAAALDCPDWLLPRLKAAHGEKAEAIVQSLRARAPVFLRVNLARTSREAARAALGDQGIVARAHALSPSALDVTEGARRIRQSRLYLDGLVEFQDAASQAVSDLVPLAREETMLDYCAGGGGKSLAVAARVKGRFLLHDLDPGRMKDVPPRAARAGVRMTCLGTAELEKHAPYQVVLVDAPCSGSGAWRRSPEGKWRLCAADLERYCQSQDRVLDAAAVLAAPDGGRLVYATCSLLDEENGDRVDAFLARSASWTCVERRAWTPLDGGDGFFAAILRRGR